MSAPAGTGAVSQVLARRRDPRLAEEFAEAVREVFGFLGWQIGLDEARCFAAVPPACDGVLAVFRPENGGAVELHIRRTRELHVDGCELLSRLLPLAARGCGTLPAEEEHVRRLIVQAVARFAGLQTDDEMLDAAEALPSRQHHVDALLGVMRKVAGRAAA